MNLKKTIVSKLNNQPKVLKVLHKIYKTKGYIQNYSAINKTISKEFNPISKEIVRDYNWNRYAGPQKYLCFAPYNNLYFDVSGKVLVCCLNRTYEIGDINKQSIEEIWNGARIEKLRTYIQNHDLSLGCEKCANAILSKNYDALVAASFDASRKINTDYPTRMEFETDNTCNLACTMCCSLLSSTYSKHFENKKAADSPYSDQFYEELNYFLPHLKFAKFSGGEPFLIDKYYDIWDTLSITNPNCEIHVQTNGSILNNKVKKVLSKLKFSIGISIDSVYAVSYEKIRIFSKFDKLIKNLEYFASYCAENKTNLNISFAPMQESPLLVGDSERLLP